MLFLVLGDYSLLGKLRVVLPYKDDACLRTYTQAGGYAEYLQSSVHRDCVLAKFLGPKDGQVDILGAVS